MSKKLEVMVIPQAFTEAEKEIARNNIGALSSSGSSNKGPWSNSESYVLNDFCTFGGDLYICKIAYTSDTESPDPSIDTDHWELFFSGYSSTYQLKGPWAVGEDYVMNDFCTVDDNLYICKSDYTSDPESDNPSIDTDHWELFFSGSSSTDDNKVKVNASDVAGYLGDKVIAASGSLITIVYDETSKKLVFDVLESTIENPLIMTSFLMSENGNKALTGSKWDGTGEWNTEGQNVTSLYYRVTTLGRGTLYKCKFWNYNNQSGDGKIRICLMNADGSLKAQSPWTTIPDSGGYDLDMLPVEGQDAIINRNTDYWIGICGYGLQLASNVKTATSFNSTTLRYAVCIKNSAGFSGTGTGWDNPVTDAVNSVPVEVPIVYMVAPEN